jgi:putative ABC transport system permease protein
LLHTWELEESEQCRTTVRPTAGLHPEVPHPFLPDEHRGFFAEYRWVTEDYLRTLGIPLQRGRQFLPEEISGKQRAAIINETMARQLWGERDAIGAQIRVLNPEWFTVIGISRDVRQSGVTSHPNAEVYFPAAAFAAPIPRWSVLVRSEVTAESLLPALRNAVRAQEQDAAVDRIMTMEDVVADSLSAQRIVAALLVCFAVLAVVIASLGLYSLVAFTVVARLPELAIRSALGSTPAELVGLVSRDGVSLILTGLVIGFGAALPLRPLVTRFVIDVGHVNASVFSAVLLISLAVGAGALTIPALRAARIDPLRILRRE